MKFYIAGKITGDLNYKEKFDKAEKALSRLGHSVMSPAWLKEYCEFSYADYIFISTAMQMKCNALLLLPDWANSPGATAEYERALHNNHAVYFDISDVPAV